MTKSSVASTANKLLRAAGMGTNEAGRLSLLLAAQAVHETGGFASDVYKENHNLFGMKANSRKYFTGENRGHATYKNDTDSIKDMIQYLMDRKGGLSSFVSSIPDYAYHLKTLNYYEDTVANYTAGMLRA